MVRTKSHGLVVMGGDSKTIGRRGIESQHWINIFSHYNVVNCNVCFQKLKINRKEAGDGAFANITWQCGRIIN